MNENGTRSNLSVGAGKSRLPLVTIITPTNAGTHVAEETITSILDQDYPNLEIIVLDDDSMDESSGHFEACDNRLRWESPSDSILAEVLNQGARLARGDLIGIVNATDSLPQGVLSPIVDALVAEPKAVLAYPDWSLIWGQLDDNGPLGAHGPTLDYSYADIVRWHEDAPGPGTLFRRALIEQIGGWDSSFDYLPHYDFFLQAGLWGPFRRVPLALPSLPQHLLTMSIDQGEGWAREHVRVIEKLYARDDLPDDVLATRIEAFRNAYTVAGLSISDRLSRGDDRFQVTDCLSQLHQDLDRRKLPRSLRPRSIIQSLHHEIESRDRELSWLHEVSAEREKEVAWLQQVVADNEEATVWLHGIMAERDKEIGWLRRGAVEGDKVTASLRQVLAERDKEIARLHREVAARDQRLAAESARQA